LSELCYLRRTHIFYTVLSLFRSNSAAILPLLLVYAILLRLTFCVVPQAVLPGETCAYLGNDLIAQWLRPKDALWLEHVVAAVLLTVQAVLISHATNKVRFARQPSYLVGVFYLLTMHLLPEYATFSPILFANTFLLLVLNQLIDVYKRKSVDMGSVFNIGFFFGLAVLIYPPYVWWTFFLVSGLFVVGRFELKSLALLLSALATLAIITGTIVFWLPNWQEVFNDRFFCHFQVPSFLDIHVTSKMVLHALAIFMATLLFLLLSWRQALRKDLAVQKVLTLTLWMVVSSLLVVLSAENMDYERLMIWSLPLALVLGFWVSDLPKAPGEFFHLALFLFVVFYQVGRVLNVV